MADLYLDMTAGVWDCEVSGGKVREINADGTDGVGEMKQRIAIALKTHRGEVYLNTTLGLPWTTEILVKAPNLSRIVGLARAYILTIEGVESVRQLEIGLDESTRQMTWTVDAETLAGVTGPFKVTA